MSLRLPSEIVVERFLPTVRACLADELHDRGLTQLEIADRLGVTQAAVSKQLGGDVSTEDRFVKDPRFRRSIDHIADGIAAGTMDEFAVLSELVALIETFEDRGPICAIHEELMPSLSGLGCDLCVRGVDDDRLTERSTLDSVRRAARRLETDPAIAGYIPKVGTNIGMALPTAEDPTEVAAIPGRIYEMRGSVAVPADPEFGCSQHVATAILAAMAVDPDIRGGLNLATDDRLLDRARSQGMTPLEFDADYEDRFRELRDRFETHADETGDVPRIVYHRGAFGIEPVTYVLGETAEDAARLARSVVAGDSHERGED